MFHSRKKRGSKESVAGLRVMPSFRLTDRVDRSFADLKCQSQMMALGVWISLETQVHPILSDDWCVYPEVVQITFSFASQMNEVDAHTWHYRRRLGISVRAHPANRILICKIVPM